ncbi:dihydrofolate reductase [Mesorhizobium sp. J18]|uniref:dihydrofolate reductase family protein n=1 Tax=Mesorhizobium sp. J18 TaxID=935263 RepID=UPI00119AF6FA|nr:dihydrofolate reductase family protein [Mesorhizobium sp. J18]TWG96834.1 dihydrofolate reductase [Mesorhizobium sp. J18]
MAATDVIYMFAMSLDGFIARPDGAIDWLDDYPADADFDFDAFMASLSGIVMGRSTYDVVRRHEAWPYAKWPCTVATTRAIDDLPDKTEAVAGSPAALLDNLRSRGANGRTWVLGGGDLVRQFIEADLLDTVEVGTIPVVLGNGILAFGNPLADVWLDLEFAKPLANGAVHSRYGLRRGTSKA